MLCRNLYAPKRVGTKFAKAAPNYRLGSAYQKDECFFQVLPLLDVHRTEEQLKSKSVRILGH